MPPELAAYLVLGLRLNLVHVEAIDLNMEWRQFECESTILYSSHEWYHGNIGEAMRSRDINDPLIAGTYWWPAHGYKRYRN